MCSNATIAILRFAKYNDLPLLTLPKMSDIILIKDLTTSLFILGHLTLVKQPPMKSLLSICLSVYPSISPPLSFLEIASLVFSDIVLDSWPWHLMTYKARFLKKKKKVVAQLWSQQAQIRPKILTILFNHDLNHGCLVFMFSFHFSVYKFLINLWQQFCVCKIFSCM